MKDMNSKITKRHLIGLSFVICHLSFSMMLASCSDWDGHYEDPASLAYSEPTLWQMMQRRSDISDFCEVLSKTKIYKHHKKTDVSYADLLNGNQTFTVLAPVNGSFNKDSLLNLLATNSGDSMVERSFVGNHLSYSLASSVATPTDFYLLNTKRVTIENNQAMNIPIKESNVKAKGGIMHVIQNTMPYRHNLYEVMLHDSRFSSIGAQLSSYQHDEFNPTQSVEGGMVDGEQIYVDSVFDERNLLLEYVGELADEDSSYIFVVPEAQEWQRVWQEAMDHFHYDSTVEDGDSLQRFWANNALLSDAIFSRTIQSSTKDSLVTYQYDRRYPQYHVFHRPFEEGGILYGAKAEEYSNGTLYTTPKWPFTPFSTYFRELKFEGERTGLIINDNLCTYTTRIHAADSVSENEYLVITPTGSNSNWSMTFKMENTLAGVYDVCAVILPPSVYDPTVQGKPCMFVAEINYVDENGEPQTFDCNKIKFTNDPTRVDTVVLAENFVFPVCNYGETNIKFSVKLQCSILAREARNYFREMFLDCIYLRPKKNVSTEQ